LVDIPGDGTRASRTADPGATQRVAANRRTRLSPPGATDRRARLARTPRRPPLRGRTRLARTPRRPRFADGRVWQELRAVPRFADGRVWQELRAVPRFADGASQSAQRSFAAARLVSSAASSPSAGKAQRRPQRATVRRRAQSMTTGATFGPASVPPSQTKLSPSSQATSCASPRGTVRGGPAHSCSESAPDPSPTTTTRSATHARPFGQSPNDRQGQSRWLSGGKRSESLIKRSPSSQRSRPPTQSTPTTVP